MYRIVLKSGVKIEVDSVDELKSLVNLLDNQKENHNVPPAIEEAMRRDLQDNFGDRLASPTEQALTKNGSRIPQGDMLRKIFQDKNGDRSG